MSTKNPRKQRKNLHRAPLHRKRKFISSHLSSKHLEDAKIRYPRAVPVRVGDHVKIMRGDDAGKEGKVASIDVRRLLITIDGITHAKADGKQVAKKIHASNIMITSLDSTDSWRRSKLEERKKE